MRLIHVPAFWILFFVRRFPGPTSDPGRARHLLIFGTRSVFEIPRGRVQGVSVLLSSFKLLSTSIVLLSSRRESIILDVRNSDTKFSFVLPFALAAELRMPALDVS